MRNNIFIVAVLAVGIAAAGFSSIAQIALAQDDPAAAALQAAREALLAEKPFSAIQTFTIKGSFAQWLSSGIERSGDFEVMCALPNKFVWKESSGPIERRLGFNGGNLISETTLPDGQSVSPAAGSAPALLLAAKQQFARLALGLFASSFPSYEMTFGPFKELESTVGVKASGPFVAVLGLDKETHLPKSLTWAIRRAGVAQEETFHYEDYRILGGIRVPARLALTIDGRLVQEWRIKKLEVNAPIKDGEFKPSGHGTN